VSFPCEISLPQRVGRLSRVCISTPTKGLIRAETYAWALRTFAELAPDVEVDPVITPKPLDHARNLQVIRFLKTQCTHLFLLDSDCLPRDQTIQRLLAYGLPIVTAPHPAVIGDELGLVVLDRAPDGYVQHHPLSGFQGPDVVVGGAGLLIERQVFEKLEPPWFQFLYDKRGLLNCGEDFFFCDRAHKAGFQIWADCDIPQIHWTTLPIKW